MPVVSNTSPLLNLAIVGRLDLVAERFAEVAIPTAVLEELRVDEELPGSDSLRQAVDDGWIRVHEVTDRALVTSLARDLDAGESEAIALAIELHAEAILLDERDARRVSRAMGLQAVGILGLLLDAKHAGELPSLADALKELREQAGFYVAPDLAAELLAAAGEHMPPDDRSGA